MILFYLSVQNDMLVLTETYNNDWTYENNYLFNTKMNMNIYMNKYSCILMSNKYKSKIYFTPEGKIYLYKYLYLNKFKKYYISYILTLISNNAGALVFHYVNNSLFTFLYKNYCNINKIILQKKCPNNYNIYDKNNIGGIILAGGFSTRFKSSINKILYSYNNKSILTYSLEAMKHLKLIIIVVNSDTYKHIENIEHNYKIIINDENDRIISIKKALNCIPNDISNIYIHDAARFMITKDHLDNLSSTNKLYSQYVIKLTNGLTNIKLYHDIERNDYLELCTPIYINVSLAKYIYNNFIPNFTYEVIYLLNVLDIDYDLIDGHLSFLKKLTYIEDINMIP